MNRNRGLSWIEQHKVFAILRGIGPEHIMEVTRALKEGGILAMEITLNTPGAEEMIRSVQERFGEDMFIGAGTVIDKEDLQRAVSAGASFIVTPNLDETVVQLALERELPIFPGAMTPGEIVRAWRAGATAVKVFPGSLAYLKELQGPLSHIPMIGLGGVHPDNVDQYLSAGCYAVGVGSSILNPKEIRAGNYAWVREQASRLMEKAASFRRT